MTRCLKFTAQYIIIFGVLVSLAFSPLFLLFFSSYPVFASTSQDLEKYGIKLYRGTYDRSVDPTLRKVLFAYESGEIEGSSEGFRRIADPESLSSLGLNLNDIPDVGELTYASLRQHGVYSSTGKTAIRLGELLEQYKSNYQTQQDKKRIDKESVRNNQIADQLRSGGLSNIEQSDIDRVASGIPVQQVISEKNASQNPNNKLPTETFEQWQQRTGVAPPGQQTEVTPTLSVIPNEQSVPAFAGNLIFRIINTSGGIMNWTASVTSGFSWLSIADVTAGVNNGTMNEKTIMVRFLQNNDSFSRTAEITVIAPGATGSPKVVAITQAGYAIISPIPIKEPQLAPQPKPATANLESIADEYVNANVENTRQGIIGAGGIDNYIQSLFSGLGPWSDNPSVKPIIERKLREKFGTVAEKAAPIISDTKPQDISTIKPAPGTEKLFTPEERAVEQERIGRIEADRQKQEDQRRIDEQARTEETAKETLKRTKNDEEQRTAEEARKKAEEARIAAEQEAQKHQQEENLRKEQEEQKQAEEQLKVQAATEETKRKERQSITSTSPQISNPSPTPMPSQTSITPEPQKQQTNDIQTPQPITQPQNTSSSISKPSVSILKEFKRILTGGLEFSTPQAHTYNRKEAAKWAETHAVHTPIIEEKCRYRPQKEGSDCTNFISTALCVNGWNMRFSDMNNDNQYSWDDASLKNWYTTFNNRSATWVNVDKFAAFAQQSKRGVMREFTKKDIPYLVKNGDMQLGDIIQYGDRGIFHWSKTPITIPSRLEKTHAMMVTKIGDNVQCEAKGNPTKNGIDAVCVSYHSRDTKNGSLQKIMDYESKKNFFLIHINNTYYE